MIQAAAETVKSSSFLFLDGVAILAIISSLSLAAANYFKWKKDKKNGNGQKPGLAPECLRHRDALTRMYSELENEEEDIKEMKGDIKELLRRIPPRE